MKNEKMLSGLLKGAIIAAGTGIGMLVAKCFKVEEVQEGEPNEPEEIILEAEEIKTEEV